MISTLSFSAEAMHIGSLMAAQGYFFPISDHVLCLKDDGTLYRFQVRRKINYAEKIREQKGNVPNLNNKVIVQRKRNRIRGPGEQRHIKEGKILFYI